MSRSAENFHLANDLSLCNEICHYNISISDAQVPRDYVWVNCDDQKVMGDAQVPQDYVWGNCDDQKVMGDA